MKNIAKNIPIPDGYMDRFYLYVKKTKSCWLWTGSISSKGYGQFTIKHKLFSSHRVAYFNHYGSIRNDLVIDHVCKNTICVNPAHLRQVSSYDNLTLYSDSPIAKNKRKVVCDKGHDSWKVNNNGSRTCSTCRKEYVKKYRATNREKILDYRRKWRAERSK